MLDYQMSLLLVVIVAVCSCRSIDMVQVDNILAHTPGTSSLSSDHYSYCNHHKSVTADEGTVFAGYSLLQVHIVLSPGQSDASSKVKVQGQSFPPMSCDFEHSHTLNDFVAMTSVYTDASRNHQLHHLHPTFPKVCANDHLTSTGFKQLISIGQSLNTSYFSNRVHKKLKPKYSSIRVESVSTEKSYQSVLGFLYGFLEEKQLYKTKIHKVNRNFCEFVESDLPSCHCSKTRALAPHVSQALTKGTFLFKSSFPNNDIITKVFQTDISDQTSGLELFNVLMQYKCDSRDEPCEKDALCNLFEEDKLARLHNILADHHLSLKTDTIFRTYSELRAYPFLQQILSRANLHNEHQSINVYTGHSHFIQFLTTSLGVFRRQITPLASRLVIEMYKKNQGQPDEGGLYLRFLYNGADVTREISGCTFQMENNLCKIAGLKELVAALRKQYLDQC
ncbi:2-phosphoxylose phosphatase 1-like [Mercenaria mercenaria]|uniref:2-phosphoxylose phosphatase 1-like n=1 Tax=Mercenaria mercenaria TaxID=6596 RepID=UPI00234F53AF|nr:2-phosphoxylose phosphatase 1-like [Mercenaria mercenaria]